MTDSTHSAKLDLNANALTVLERRYLVKDDHGKPAESPEDLFWRVARNVAAPDRAYGASDRAVEGLAEAFFDLMATRVWMPNSPTLMNAGRPLGQLSACFVRPFERAVSSGTTLLAASWPRGRPAFIRVGERDRFFVFAPAAQERRRPVHDG